MTTQINNISQSIKNIEDSIQTKLAEIETLRGQIKTTKTDNSFKQTIENTELYIYPYQDHVVFEISNTVGSTNNFRMNTSQMTSLVNHLNGLLSSAD